MDVDRRRAEDVPWVVGYGPERQRADVDVGGGDAAATGAEEVAKDCSVDAGRAAGQAVDLS